MTEQIQLPNQKFPTTTGEINLSELSTDWLVLYFYPKDSTPGCTTQAVGFSCIKDQFDALNTTRKILAGQGQQSLLWQKQPGISSI
jgi:peroxiredoxin Q/BCP